MDLDTADSEPWNMWFDGSKANGLARIGVVIKSPQGAKTTHGFRIDETTCSNNQAEYEALVMRLEILIDLQVHVVNIFGDSQLTITVDNGTVFDGKLVKAFTAEYGISLVNSTPYYAQANGQAESLNKSLKKGMPKVVEDNPRDWHNLLLDVLWAYRTSQRSSTRITPYALVYGHDAVLSMEINIKSLSVNAKTI
ncbi:uncharacterized protein LOC114293539 [Camellia sinensis]|uniref:uncharacterized protein LOC114293539 n=1 Tax=Camellia sinensis TaxID=4442 RepID=UPI00103606C2|nr:uncharacterized protein LOC114293539 [Camellia sinensis]